MKKALGFSLLCCFLLFSIGCKRSDKAITSDEEKGVITWSGLDDSIVDFNSNVDLLEGIVAIDSIEGDLSKNIRIVDRDKFNVKLPRTYQITYEVMNSKGVKSMQTKKITVQAKKPNDSISYFNPVFEPIFADPAVIRGDDGYFYAYATEDYSVWQPNQAASSQVVPIIKSNDLVNWEFIGSAFTYETKPSWGTPGANVWAPDIVKIGEAYNLYYSLSTWGDPNPGIGVATGPTPTGPWTDHGKLFDSFSIGVNNSIDPTVFVDDDGRVYMIWGSFRGLYGVELTANGLELIDGEQANKTKVHIAGLDTATPWNGATYEAPYLIKKDNLYYLFVSSGTCCDGFNSTYNIRVARSESPLGPFEDHLGQSMLGENRGYQVLRGGPYFVGTGHNSIVIDDAGNYWITYHGFDRTREAQLNGVNRRSLLISKLEWNAADWPRVYGGATTDKSQPSPVINK